MTDPYAGWHEYIAEMVEKENDFVLSHFQKYAERKHLLDVTHIPKELIKRSIECFAAEHREEYEHLMAVVNERQKI